MIRISADHSILGDNKWSIDGVPPQRLGNHLLNFFFCCSLASRHNYNLTLPCKSQIEDICAHNLSYESEPRHSIYAKGIWTSNNLVEAARNSHEQYLHSLSILDNGVTRDTTIRGYYMHSDLVSIDAIERFVKFKISGVKLDTNDVLLHIRGTDYIKYGRPTFKNLVPGPTYWTRAISLAQQLLGDIHLKVVTDDPALCAINLNGYSYEIIDLDAAKTWLLIRESEYLIMPFSTFSWTAAACSTKTLVIQPLKGQNFETPDLDSIPYGWRLNNGREVLAATP